MASAEKRRLIKDPVWGNLEIFSWENQLLNHFLFNRLHNIVQNSSAYKVYPGLKYSRFLHSVGVAHVASELFVNAAAKADGKAKAALSLEIDHVETLFTSEAKSEIIFAVGRSFLCPQNCAVTLEAVRIAALIHDIGHLPFSHVFENAIDGFCHGEFGDAIRLTPAAKKQRDELNLLLSHQPDRELLKKGNQKGGTEQAKIHEILGRMFLEVLQTSFQENSVLVGLLKAAKVILTTNKLPLAKGFIVGTMDADRIDFVKRDGFFSGLFTSSVDFGRLFAFYELAEDRENKCWRPRPSQRTSSETEKLLFERFLDYKYIIVHHRVHLYDEIMENILVRLMANGTLSGFVDTLCQLLKYAAKKKINLSEQQARVELLRSLLTSFDDPWLEISIRQQYKNIIEADDEMAKVLLEAYVEDRRSFRTAFKTDQDFERLCAKYAPALLEDPISVRNAFGASKYILQKSLGKILNKQVLIGSTDKKLSFGIRNDIDAAFLGIGDLYEFLVKKKIHSFTFNFWYRDDASDEDVNEREHEKVIATALTYLQEQVTKQLQLVISEALAK